MKTILLESKKDVVLVNCPKCGAIYAIPHEKVANTVVELIADGKQELVVRCPHCLNFNDYSKAEWVEAEEIDAVIHSKKEMLNKAGF